MYANLRVEPHPGATLRPDAIAKQTLARWRAHGDLSVLPAYSANVNADGSVSIGLDENMDGNYYEHAGHVRIEGGCLIQADF